MGELVPGAPVAMCEGVAPRGPAGRLPASCRGVLWLGQRGRWPQTCASADAAARLVLVPDVGKEESAAEIAQALQGAPLPTCPRGARAELRRERPGHSVTGPMLAELLEDASEPAPPRLPVLSVAFADELPGSIHAA